LSHGATFSGHVVAPKIRVGIQVKTKAARKRRAAMIRIDACERYIAA
jgi:hypothetical protein